MGVEKSCQNIPLSLIFSFAHCSSWPGWSPSPFTWSILGSRNSCAGSWKEISSLWRLPRQRQGRCQPPFLINYLGKEDQLHPEVAPRPRSVYKQTLLPCGLPALPPRAPRAAHGGGHSYKFDQYCIVYTGLFTQQIPNGSPIC